jgi:hypothetical protein
MIANKLERGIFILILRGIDTASKFVEVLGF